MSNIMNIEVDTDELQRALGDTFSDFSALDNRLFAILTGDQYAEIVTYMDELNSSISAIPRNIDELVTIN